MVLDTLGPAFYSSTYGQDGAPDDGTRSCSLDAGPSSYYYNCGPYDYVSGLTDRFHDVLHAVEQPLCNGCTTSQLAIVAELEDIKADGHISQRIYDRISQWEGSMVYLSDAEAWRHFDRTHPDFAAEPRNIRLGLCMDGFAPQGQYGRTYICWPIILTPYNLPPRMCMSFEYVFLNDGHPRPFQSEASHRYLPGAPDRRVAELWYVGVQTHDNAKDKTFTMRAALMWTVNDLPAYGMASGWSIAGVMGVQSVWKTHVLSICRKVGRHATLTATDSSSPRSSLWTEEESIH
ncbi:UNVERIFIED_CONTAM: hypothetical protein Sradi_5250600 [Sesamum radiatum]|uniref:Uncharacterized protein n=1 Tax=Sesamum radiatum TaxID=300843 RepID=A0AAW2LLH3_SESRA